VRRAALGVLVLVVAAGWALAATSLWGTVVPDDLELPVDRAAASFDAGAAREARDFERLLMWLGLAGQVALVLVLALYARHGVRLMRESAAGPIGTGFLLGILGIALVWLVQVPFGLVETWWVRRHDVVEVGYLEWLVGDFLALSSEAVFLCLVLLVVMALARVLRSAWWLPAAAAFTGLALLFAWVGPYLVVGLERPAPDVAADARRLAPQQGVEGVPVRVEPVREFTEAPNAYAMGLGDTRRVVLWDTLAEDFPRAEVRSVLSHEFGHLQHDHIRKSIAWLGLGFVPTALLVALVTRRRGGLGDPRAVPLALLVFVVVQLALSPLQSAVSRSMEAEADWAALEATRDPDALRSLHHRFTREALADPDPPGWFHVAFSSHPSGAERVAMAMAWQERRRGRGG
jgi:STE24 endopeptidase